MSDSRIEPLREFAAVARRLSFRAAADDLGLDPTVLSRRIARLEARLGVRLLHRTSRKVALTEAGALFLARCEDLLSRLGDAEAEVSRYAASLTGTLRIAVPNVFGQLQIAPILPEFMERNPDLRVEVTFSDRMVDLVANGLDASVRIGALEAGGDLVVKRLSPIRRVLCASPAYLAAHGPPDRPEDLAKHRTLHFSPLLAGTAWRLRAPGREVEVAIDPILRADNVEALRYAALAGHGIALLATFVAHADLASGRLVVVLPAWEPLESDVSLVYPNAPFTPRKVRAFADLLAEHFRGVPPWERKKQN